MSPTPVAVRLPPRRLEQLKALGSALNLSLADAVAHMLRKEIEAGTIPDALPGIQVRKSATGISIAIDDNAPADYTKESARELAASIRSVVAGASGVVNMDYRFSVLRQGSGYKIALPFPGPETIFSGDLALDFARLIQKAAE